METALLLAATLLAVLLTNIWRLNEKKWLDARLKLAEDRIKELDEFKWEARNAFRECGLKYEGPKSAQPARWVSE